MRHAGVVAVPHPVAGNTLTGFVELQDGASASAAELRAFLTGRLPHQMVPARLDMRQRIAADGQRQDRSAGPERVGGSTIISRNLNRRRGRRRSHNRSHAAPRHRRRLCRAGWQRSGVSCWASATLPQTTISLRSVATRCSRFGWPFRSSGSSGARVTLVALIEASTLSQMADLLRDPEVSRDVTSAPATEKEIVPPMLCVGAGPLFRPFAEALAPRCKFHSVPTPVLSAGSGIATMEDLAARMVPSILASHPSGPLMLAGWSLAGVVAVELAVQLERAGRDVSTVILFDTLSPVRHRQWFSSSPLIRQWQLNVVKARYHVQEAITRGVAGAVRYLMSTMRDARARAHYDRLLREAAAGRPGSLMCRWISGTRLARMRRAIRPSRCVRASSWCDRNARSAARCSPATWDGRNSATASICSPSPAITSGCSRRRTPPCSPIACWRRSGRRQGPSYSNRSILPSRTEARHSSTNLANGIPTSADSISSRLISAPPSCARISPAARSTNCS